MNYPPFRDPLSFKEILEPQNSKEALWFVFCKDQLLVSSDHHSLPIHPPLPHKEELLIGTLNKTHIYACHVEEQTPPLGWTFCPLRSLFESLSDDHFALAGRSMNLLRWFDSHKYCGYCGHETRLKTDERSCVCTNCEHHFYPNLAPAIMALVRRENQILLAHAKNFPRKCYSVIAGFVDPGETLEQCVMREVFEEVGVEVENICYFASQPWPFSHSLMIGFTCDWKSGEIKIDPKEIVDAQWFDINALPEHPSPYSLSSLLIQSACTKTIIPLET